MQEITDLLPVENPSLIHGDLWSGNLISDRQGEPVLIDPAVYYGCEMDLAMLNLLDLFHQKALRNMKIYFLFVKDGKRTDINQFIHCWFI